MLHTDNNSQQFTGNTFSQGFYEPIHIKKVVSMKVIKNSYFLIIKCFYFIKKCCSQNDSGFSIVLPSIYLYHLPVFLCGCSCFVTCINHCISSLLLDDTQRHRQFATNGGGSRNMSKRRTVCRGQRPVLHLNHVFV